MTNDRRKLLILMLEPIVIGMLLYVVCGEHIFDVFTVGQDGKEYRASLAYNDTKSMMFTLSCAAIWIGLFNSIQTVLLSETFLLMAAICVVISTIVLRSVARDSR